MLILRLSAAGALLCALAGCRQHPISTAAAGAPEAGAVEVLPPPAAILLPGSIRVAAFNVQAFGMAKASSGAVMEILVRIAREFDLLVVQEIQDASEQVAGILLERINARSGSRYEMYEGPRLGRTRHREQCAVYYRAPEVAILGARVAPDPSDRFEREPLILTFRSGSFDFTIIAAHIKPGDARSELEALASLALAELREHPEERDLILLGDLNMDCRYFDENDGVHPIQAEPFQGVISNDVDTTTSSTDCTYDRIILTGATRDREYVVGSAGVFRFDEIFGLENPAFVREVSDHYPVMAEFLTNLEDDD